MSNVLTLNPSVSKTFYSWANLADIVLDRYATGHRNFQRINLTRAIFNPTNLSGIDFGAAILDRAILTGCNLTGANLSGADLSGVNLTVADLTGADLRQANLRHTNLKGADLTGADLTGADLTGANLTGADLTGAIAPDGTRNPDKN